MLRQRVITAIVLLALLLPALLATPAWPFGLLTLLLIGAGGWEWARLNGLTAPANLVLGGVVAALCLVIWASGLVDRVPAALWWGVGVCWLIGGGLALRAGPTAWPHVSRAARLLLGVVMLCAAWMALASARARGLNFILSAFCIVWMADIAAYAGGRLFGRRKLAPTISPGKSWEGVWTGLAGVLLLGLIWLWLTPAEATAPSVFSALRDRFGWTGAGVALLGLGGMSVMGDLIESLAKRAGGAKDSSGLLPGHGGVLDRVDALLPVLPAVMALCTL